MLQHEIDEAKEQILAISAVNPKKCMVCWKCSATSVKYE